MASIISGFEYDIFISYRHNDNRSGWVTEFVNALQEELAATIKEPLSIYFDKNPHDGLLETHDVDDSLKEKLKCLIFIPIISQTYCDPKSFAWQHEFLVFLQQAGMDAHGLKVKLPNGNTGSRVLPIRIHELDAQDKKIIEAELGPLRAIDFTYQSAGVNRPLWPKDDESSRGSQNIYRDQINKTANAIKEIVAGLQGVREGAPLIGTSENRSTNTESFDAQSKRKWNIKPPSIKTLFGFSLFLVLTLSAALFRMVTNQDKKSDTDQYPIKTSIVLPDSLPLSFKSGSLGTGRRALDISPDGKTIVFTAMDKKGNTYLCLRPLGEDKVFKLAGTEGAFSPFFSPDAKWVAFFSQDKLKKISVDGGVIEMLASIANPLDGVWGEDDRITYIGNEGGTLNSIDSHGENFRIAPSMVRFFSRPIWLSSHEFILTSIYNRTFVVSLSNGEKNIILTKENIILTNCSSQAICKNELFFMKGNDLFAIDFDREKKITVGNPRLIEKEISVDNYNNSQFAISKNGTAVFANGPHAHRGQLVWRNLQGEILILPFESQVYGTFSLSPDGNHLTVIKKGDQSEVWNYDLNVPGNKIQLSQQGFNSVVVWSPNSNWIYYQSVQNRKPEIFRRQSDGRSEAQVVLSDDSLRSFLDIDKMGNIVYTDAETDGRFSDLRFLEKPNSKRRYSFVSKKGAIESMANFIGDGWIAFTSDQTGRSEVFLEDLMNPSARTQISFEGGEEPRYDSLSKTLYYRNGTKMMGASLVFGVNRSVEIGASKIIFDDENWVNVFGYSYDLSPDGKQFLMVRSKRKNGTTEIKVAQNFIK